MGDLVQLFEDWWKRPFDPEGDVTTWTLFLGFVIIVAILWSRIIRSITTE